MQLLNQCVNVDCRTYSVGQETRYQILKSPLMLQKHGTSVILLLSSLDHLIISSLCSTDGFINIVSSLWGSNLCGSPANPSQKETHWTKGVDFGDRLINNISAVLMITTWKMQGKSLASKITKLCRDPCLLFILSRGWLAAFNKSIHMLWCCEWCVRL